MKAVHLVCYPGIYGRKNEARKTENAMGGLR